MVQERATQLEVEAPAVAWSVLADFAAYREWSSFLRRVRGTPEVGARLFVNARPPRARGMMFRPRVTRVDPPRELAFRGQLIVPGLFDGQYRFTVEPLDADRCRIGASLAFSGRLVPLLAWKTGAHLAEGLAAQCADWKRRTESLAT